MDVISVHILKSAWRDFRSYDKSDNLGKKKSDWTELAGREYPERGGETFKNGNCKWLFSWFKLTDAESDCNYNLEQDFQAQTNLDQKVSFL